MHALLPRVRMQDRRLKCACGGGDMIPDRDIGSSVIYKCTECGLSESRLKEAK